MQSDLLSISILLILISILPHAFSISVISSLTWCTKRGWGRAGRQPISGPQQYAALGRAEKYARCSKQRNMQDIPSKEVCKIFQKEKYARYFKQKSIQDIPRREVSKIFQEEKYARYSKQSKQDIPECNLHPKCCSEHQCSVE